jgi:hypothetical protein
MIPRDMLLTGVKIINRVLEPQGFSFHLRGEGSGSGGPFAWGEFIRDDRRLEVHFRYSLGLVTYHIGGQAASHEIYMRELGVWDQCRYPSFSSDPLASFEELAHDLKFATDFSWGPAKIFQRAAHKEEDQRLRQEQQAMQAAVGDTRRIHEIEKLFRSNRFDKVIQLASQLQFPDRLSPAEKRMIELARQRRKDK